MIGKLGRGLLLGLTVLFLGQSSVPGEQPGAKAEPKPQSQRLLQGDDAKKAEELDKQAIKNIQEDKYPEAIRAAKELLALRSKVQGEDHWQTADAQYALKAFETVAAQPEGARREFATLPGLRAKGLALMAKGQYQNAQPLFAQIARSNRKLLGENHPDTVNSLNNLAMNLYKQGKYDEAETLYRQALALRLKVQGENHPDTAKSLGNLAGNLHAQGKFDEAGPLYRQALALDRKLLGENHPTIVNRLIGLAGNLYGQGKYDEAEPLYRQALDLNRKLRGENHPDTVSILSHLASNLNAQGKFDEAETLYRQALTLNRKFRGENHPDTVHSLNNLGTNLYAQGKYDEAEPLYRQALALDRKLRGENHPDTATSLNNLALNLNAQGKFDEAESLLRQALALHRKLLGENHPSTANSLISLAGNLNEQGKYDEAEPLVRQALALFRKLRGENHSDTASSLNNLAYNLNAQGKYDEAEPLFRQALELRRKLLGEKHPSTVVSLNNLAFNLNDQRRYDQAEPLYRQALALSRKRPGENHPSTAFCLTNLAWNLNLQGKFDEAETLLRQALALRRKLLGENHTDTAASLGNLAAALKTQGKYDEAEQYAEQSCDVFLRLRTSSARVGIERASRTSKRSSLRGLAALHARHGKFEQAWTRLEQGLGRATWDELSIRRQRSIQEQTLLDQLQAQLRLLDRRILQNLSHETPAPEQDQLRKDLLEQQRKIYKQLDELYASLEAKYGVREGLSFPLAKIQSSLPLHTALLAWVDLEGLPIAKDPNGEHWAVLVRSRGTPLWLRLPGTGPKNAWTAADDKLPGRLKNALTGQTAVPATALAELTRQLTAQRITPLRSQLAANGDLPAVRQLVVLPSPSMDGIPVELLVESITVSYASSGTFFAHLKEQKPPVTASVLALGAPNFDQPGSKDPPAPLPPGGILVTVVAPGSPAAKAQLRPADVLLRYHQTDLKSVDDLKTAIVGPDLPDAIVLRFWRNGKTEETRVPPGKLGVALDLEPALVALKRQRELDKLLATRGDANWKPLPGTRGEVETLRRLFAERKTPVQVLTGSEASEQKLYELGRSGELGKVRYLHLATHGQMNLDNQLQSAIILARDRLPDPLKPLEEGQYPFDGRLTAEEVLQQWKLDAELVTLSACQTGLGKQEEGEGFMGFAQAVLLSGSRSVCLSLWKVDDTATMLLMDRFYRNLLGQRDGLAKPMGKAEALAEAKNWLRTLPRKEVLDKAAGLLKGVARDVGADLPPLLPERPEEPKDKNEPPFAHPRYWAAFILIGAPK